MCVKSQEFQGLPVDVLPYHYNITLTLDLKTFTSTGQQDVSIDVKESTNKILLTAADLKIRNVAFHNINGTVVASGEISFDATEEKVTIMFPEKIPAGKSGHLHFEFQGEINDKMRGLYRSKYTGFNALSCFLCGRSHIQFFANSTCARRCFPCWDEPIFKATFDITLKVSAGFTAISNMPVKSVVNHENKTSWSFERTPIMSSYLVAFVVGEFDYLEGKTSDGLVTRVYTPKGKADQGQFALDIATRAISLYGEYFGIPYSLPKLDLIAIADFAFGAMENWGLVTYRETRILVDSENTSIETKQAITLVVCHELAHKWFGNLVTMKWWDELWLKEGYASFMEFFATDKLFPEYESWTQFTNLVYKRALQLDALKSTHPIHVPVNRSADIDEIFDKITYCKAPSVIRMLYYYIGDEDFKKGMSQYLKKFSYSNAVSEDLWTALEEASKKPIRAIMPTWIKQKGFPILTVQHRWEGSDLVLTFCQKKFIADGSDDPEKSLWMIPLNVTTSLSPEKAIFSTVMHERTKEVLLKDVHKDSWVKVNPGTVGFYRTSYSSDLLELLIPAIESGMLTVKDRFGVIDDMFAFVQAGQVSTVEYLRLVKSFKEEENGTVWSSIISSLNNIQTLVADSDFDSSFKAFARSLLRSINSKLGWDPKPKESHLSTVLRSSVLETNVSLQEESTIQEAKDRFQLHISGKTILSPDLRNLVYRAILFTGDKATFETMLKLYREADLSEEKARILKSLGVIKDEALLTKALEFALSDQVRFQDTHYVISTIRESSKGRDLVWEFFKQNWNVFEDRYKGGLIFPHLVRIVTENFVTEEKALEIQQFFDNHPTNGVEKTVRQSVEYIRLKAAWLNRDKDSIKKYLTSEW
ncbi:puromycin-sensitive aminopeptidase-like [Belonocnema kinseyi]|uniref:puromycin-sensitive aminopeptidase-like n=1 Tax=Belonocnema kinseyi TaxID=2817044 RepID=UPI00143D33D8|nr:puromycin-sensitive aminopeptidase-like [Belonocnema kinseyi]